MKLKTILALVASAAMAGAQPASPFRFVNGQLYNIEKSKLWNNYQLAVRRTDTNGVVGILFSYKEIGGGVHDYNQKVWGAHVLVLHPSRPVATGNELGIRAMQVGTTNCDGRTLEVLDCGTTNLVRVATTNRPASKQ